MSIPSLRAVPTETVPSLADVPQSQPESLRLDTLHAWRLQRPLDEAAARRIAKNFDPYRLHPLLISRRGGIDYVLDGQHRWHALVKVAGWGHLDVPCQVYEGLTDEQEDKLFHAQAPGMRRPLSALHAFRVLTDMRDTQALRIVATVERVGLHIAHTGSSGDDTVIAVKALIYSANYYGIDRLETTLRTLKSALGPESVAYTSDMIRAFGQFLVRFEDEYDAAEFTRKVRAVGTEGVLRQAYNLRAAHGGNMVTNIGKAFHEIYNAGKRGRRLGTWQEKFRAADVEARARQRTSTTRGVA